MKDPSLKHEAKTTHDLAAKFDYYYNSEFAVTECPNCGNYFDIEKESVKKDIGLRIWRIFIRYTEGEVYFPLKHLLFGSLYSVKGFLIINTSAGEDQLMCYECREIFPLDEVNTEDTITLTQEIIESAEKDRKEAEEQYREKMLNASQSELFTLPDGSNLSPDKQFVLIRYSDMNNKGPIRDIVRIRQYNRRLIIKQVPKSEIRLWSIFKNPDSIKEDLIAQGTRDHKQNLEEHLFEKYSPHDHTYEPTTFKKAISEILKQRIQAKHRLYRNTASPFDRNK